MLSSVCNNLIVELKTLSVLAGIDALLGWDQETYMPPGAIDARSDQMALMAKYGHQAHASDRFRGLLGEWVNLDTGALNTTTVSAVEATLLTEVYRDWKLATALPESFVQDFARAKAGSQHAWQEARQANDFAAFQPHLEAMVSFNRQKAQFLSSTGDVYTTLLDTYEPGLSSVQLTPIFDALKHEIVTILSTKNTTIPFPIHEKTWDADKQWQFSQMILTDMGFDFTRGRLDKSAHPFSTQLHPTDVRITTRISPHDFLEGLGSTIHECGHALYEQGLPLAYEGTPLCSAISFGVHESQSRFWENGVGKNRHFWAYYFPKLCALFPENIHEKDFDAFMAAVLHVSPGRIRVQADELTYNLHILIRYELEQALFSGQLKVADLPSAWREKYQAYLGVSSDTDADGVLQDVHWSCGYFGYFPTYTVGNLYAAMLLDRIGNDLKFDTLLAAGQLRPIRDWLYTNVHQVGRQKTAQEWITGLTGQDLTVEAFAEQMRRKYGGV